MLVENDLIVRMRSICKSFPGVKALDGAELSCRKGEIHALLGENGAGKSTLIKILGGVLNPDLGEILYEGVPVSFRSPQEAQLAGISTIHQELILVPYMTVAENIFLGQEQTNRFKFVRPGEMNREARKMLALVGADLCPSDTVAALDSTNQKLVQIAKTLVKEPKILIVDEPTAPLGSREVENFFSALRKLKDKGTTIIYISHHLEEVFHIADRVTILKDGQNVATLEVGETQVDEVIRLMIGRELGDLFPRKKESAPPSRKVLEVRGVDRGRTLFDVDLDLYSGEILGIAGLEGNGQNTLLRTVFGSYGKDRGKVRVDGEEIRISGPADAIRAGMALITDKRHQEGLCLRLSVQENLALPTLKNRQTLGIIKKKSEQDVVRKNIEKYAIKTPSPRKQALHLSGGNQQKIVIGKWLNNDPRILFFLEPTLGVDVGAKAEIYQFVRDLADSEGKGVVLVTSDMLELLGLCDRILVMHQGRVVKTLMKDEATEEKILKAAVGVV